MNIESLMILLASKLVADAAFAWSDEKNTCNDENAERPITKLNKPNVSLCLFLVDIVVVIILV